MKEDEAKYLYDIIDEISYNPNAFTIWYGGDKIILGALLHDNAYAQKFFSYATIYHTILDIDKKIKFSLYEAIKQADGADFDNWNPLSSPSDNESTSIYYTENAVFRTAILWDMLAQLYNIKEGKGKPIEKVYATQLFHDAQQGKRADPFAQKVYSYMTQTDDMDDEPWKGNYTFVREFRDKMTHRNSPNISAISDFAVELRMPMILVLKRVTEDYSQVSVFIRELISEILEDYKLLNEHTPTIDNEGK